MRPSLLCLVLLLSACSRKDDADLVVGTLERDRLELVAEANEPVEEVVVREGDKVAAGALLLRQSQGLMQEQLAQLTAAAASARTRFAQLVKGPRAQEIIEGRAAREAAQSDLATQDREFERVTNLIKRGLVSASELDQTRARRDAAAATLKQTQARLDMLLEGTRREEIEQAESALQQAQAALAEARISSDRHTVTAPRAGRIEAIPYKLGERPPPGAPVIVMLVDSTPFARVYVPETRRAQFASGTRVNIKVDGSDATFPGVVRFISAEAAFTPYYALTQRDRTQLSFLAEIDLDVAAAADLPTGMPVQVTLAAN